MAEESVGKRILVMSGGGSKGSYQAGVVSHLMGTLGLRYDGFCGVSVGAINGLHLAQYKDEEAEEAAAGLVEFWEGISTDQVYKNWFLGRVRALCKPSVYDSRPLASYLVDRVSIERVQTSGKKLRVGAVSLDSGEYRLFTETDEEIMKGVLASAAYPVMLLPVPIEGQLWSDGGIRNVTPLKAAVELGATEVDVIMCTPTESTWKALEKPNAIDVLGRMVDIMVEEIIETDLKLALAYNELAKLDESGEKKYIKMRVIRPETSLPGASLNFDDHIDEKIKRGVEDAKRICG